MDKALLVLFILMLILATMVSGCDDGRPRRAAAGRPATPPGPGVVRCTESEAAPAAPPEPVSEQSDAVIGSAPVETDVSVPSDAKNAGHTAVKLGEVVTTLGELCREARETRKDLLESKFQAGSGAVQAAKEVTNGNE